MSNIALSWAFRCHVGNASAKAVLVYLADRADDDGTAAYPKIATIVNVTELSERTVRAALKTLQERGSSAAETNVMRVSARAAGTVCHSTARSCGTSRSNPTRRPSSGSGRRTPRNGIPRPWARPWTRRPEPCSRTANPRTCCRKTLEPSRFPALQISQGWKTIRKRHCKSRRASTARAAPPALQIPHLQHCKSRRAVYIRIKPSR